MVSLCCDRQVLAILLLACLQAFVVRSFAPRSYSTRGLERARRPTILSASTTDTETDDAVTAKGLLKRDRYIATNRFAVRKGQQAKFEKRWATRKSRLATLPGFRYFHLMRRINVQEDGSCTYDGGDTDEDAQENYVSFTIWDKKSDFSAWRKGDAFKEAHGGTSIGAFVSTMVNSAMVLRGPPRPAFYDGLLTLSSNPTEKADTVDGWRNVQADGVTTLPAECFVGLEKFYVFADEQQKFEKLWADRKSTVSDFDGFVAFSLLRRDGQAKGHGMGEVSEDEPNYVSVVVFKDKESADKWVVQHRKEAEAKKKKQADHPIMWNREPERIFYEGTLVIASDEGA